MRLHETYTRLYGTYNRGCMGEAHCYEAFYGSLLSFFVPEGVPVLNSIENERNNSLRQSVIFHDYNIFIYNDNSLRCHF